MGVPTTFAVFQDSDFLSSVDGVGIDHCYSPRMEAAKELLRLLDTNPVKEISDLGEGQTFIYEVKACSSGTDINVPLKIKFPDQSFIAGISRDEDFIIPATNTIQPDDLLIVIGDKASKANSVSSLRVLNDKYKSHFEILGILSALNTTAMFIPLTIALYDYFQISQSSMSLQWYLYLLP